MGYEDVVAPREHRERVTGDGRLVATKASAGDRVAAAYGLLRGRLRGGTDAFLRQTRGPGPDE